MTIMSLFISIIGDVWIGWAKPRRGRDNVRNLESLTHMLVASMYVFKLISYKVIQLPSDEDNL
jgi:hypothetical protein